MKEMPNTSSCERYTIFPANNKPSAVPMYARGWAYPYNGNNELTNTSQPAATLNNANTDGTFFMSKPLTDMDVVDGLAAFCFQGATVGIEELLPPSNGKDKTFYDISGRYLGNDFSRLPRGIYLAKNADNVTKIVKR